MFVRALIVLLLALNLGVAAWWVARPVAAPEPSPPAPAGVAPLRLLGEASPAPTPSRPEPAGPPRCLALGPFDSEAEASASRTALMAWGATRARIRPAGSATRGWTVAMPAVAEQAAAQAMAERIRAAGFEDLLVMPVAGGGHGVALGRYGSEASARQRVAALRTAGFDARANPIADPSAARWVDVAVPRGRDVADARRVAEAASSEAVDCGTVVDGPLDAPR